MNVVYSLVLSYFQGNLTKLNFKNSQKLTVVQWGLMLNKLHMREWEEHLKSTPFGLSSIGSFQGVLNPLSKLNDV